MAWTIPATRLCQGRLTPYKRMTSLFMPSAQIESMEATPQTNGRATPFSNGWQRRPGAAPYSQGGWKISRTRFLESTKNFILSIVWPTVLPTPDATGHTARSASCPLVTATGSNAETGTTRRMRLHPARGSRRQIPFRRSVIADILQIDGSEGTFTRGFLHSMRGKTDN